MTNKDYAINYLHNFWWPKTDSAALTGSIGWSNAIAFYESKGSFLDQFGETAKNVDEDKVKAALEKLGAQSGTRYPAPAEFFAVLAEGAQKVTVQDVQNTVVDTAAKAAKTLEIGGSIGLMLAVGGAALLLLGPVLLRHA